MMSDGMPPALAIQEKTARCSVHHGLSHPNRCPLQRLGPLSGSACGALLADAFFAFRARRRTFFLGCCTARRSLTSSTDCSRDSTAMSGFACCCFRLAAAAAGLLLGCCCCCCCQPPADEQSTCYLRDHPVDHVGCLLCEGKFVELPMYVVMILDRLRWPLIFGNSHVSPRQPSPRNSPNSASEGQPFRPESEDPTTQSF